MSLKNWRSWLLPASLAILLVNGWVAEAMAGGTPAGPTWVSIGPFELAAVLVGFWVFVQIGELTGPVLVPSALLLAAAMVPSGLVAWMGLGLVSGFAAWRMPRARWALLLFAGIAVCHLMQVPAFKLVAGPVQALEANVVAAVAGWLVGPTSTSGNLVYLPDGRSLVILPGCSLLATAAPALLGWLALRVWRRLPIIEAWPAAVLLLAALAVLNTARMVGMCVAPDWYHSLHEGVGSTMVDLVAVALVFVTAQPWHTGERPCPATC